jgi:hypothetical protein
MYYYLGNAIIGIHRLIQDNNIRAECRACCTSYLDCIGSAFKNCFNAISEKCADCFHHNDNAALAQVELAGSNVNDNMEGQA